jgi:hypothetical protein
MPSQIAANKTKIAYSELNETRDALAEERELVEKELGVQMSEAEFLRWVHIQFANERRKKRKAKLLTVDPFASGAGVSEGHHIAGYQPSRRRKAA